MSNSTYTKTFLNKVKTIKLDPDENESSCINMKKNNGFPKLADIINNKIYTRTFAEGLYTLLNRCGYQGSKEKKAMLKYITNNNHNVDIDPSLKKSFSNWIDGKNIPTNRTSIYKLCFAINASYEDVKWFFEHVCFQNSFYLHAIDEVIYFYCLNNHLDYLKVQELINQINSLESEKNFIDQNYEWYTHDNTKNIPCFKKDSELIDFFKKNIYFYRSTFPYQGAYKKYIELKNNIMIVDKENGKNIDWINNLKVPNKKTPILQKELYNDKHSESLNNKHLKNSVLTSNEWFLKQCYGMKLEGKKQYVAFLSALPRKKELSDFDNKKSLGNLRNTLILLSFYEFNYNITNENLYLDENDDEDFSLSSIFINETNEMLIECGFQPLTEINPYDLVFICCSRSSYLPLTTFHELIAHLAVM